MTTLDELSAEVRRLSEDVRSLVEVINRRQATNNKQQTTKRRRTLAVALECEPTEEQRAKARRAWRR